MPPSEADWPSLLALLLSYVAGSIPTGLWLGQAMRGVDIREHGSRNIGATNTLRVLGKPLGAAALAGDMLKGLVAVAVFARLGAMPQLPLYCGIAAILGHTFSVFLRFRGGKGVATGAGVFLGLAPAATGIAAAVFALVAGTTRMVSAASLCAAIALTAAVFALPHGMPVRVAAALVAALVLFRHRSNIARILKGEENRF